MGIIMKILNSPGCKNSPKNLLTEDYCTQILSQKLDIDYEFINHHNFDLNTISTIEFIATISHGAHGSCLGKINNQPFSMHVEYIKPSKLIVRKAELFTTHTQS